MDYYNNYLLDDLYVWQLSDSDKKLLDAAIWIVDNKTTIRKTAKEFCISSSSLHRNLHSKLRKLSYELYCCVKRQLNSNKKKYFN